MPWSQHSFLVESKPKADYASLYVACDESESRDIVRILYNSIDLCSSYELVDQQGVPDDILDQLSSVQLEDASSAATDVSASTSASATCDADAAQYQTAGDECVGNGSAERVSEKVSSSLCAVIIGLKMDPESVKNFSWMDDHQTFACKLKIELVDHQNGNPRSWSNAVKNVQPLLSGLESYCSCLNDCDVVFRCNSCGHALHKQEKLRSLKFYKLPSVEFNEVVDELFCHQHEQDVLQRNSVYNYFVNGPNANQCFIGSHYLLMNPDTVDNCVVAANTSLVLCQNCRQCVGTVDQSVSYKYFPKRNSFQIYHIVTDLIGQERQHPDLAVPARNFFNLRYESKEQFFSWLVLSECDTYSTLYFVVKTLDFHPKLMIWVLDAFTVMTIGRLKEGNLQDSGADACKPFAAIKILYRKLSDNDLRDPFVSGQHTGIGTLHLPDSACDLMLAFLDASCLEMPLICRTMGNFAVGFLPVCSEF